MELICSHSEPNSSFILDFPTHSIEFPASSKFAFWELRQILAIDAMDAMARRDDEAGDSSIVDNDRTSWSATATEPPLGTLVKNKNWLARRVAVHNMYI